ncbi:ankyrin repeat domain-containing protein [Chryseobacterium balustinum]|uniref:ankyrin repeat domain-containing protein n=1 Tax=Chryseobacterium balustinum TaxID=246 RepID=UPI003CF27656
MNHISNQHVAIYSISNLFPLFEYMHNRIGLSSDLFKEQNEIARTIWLAIRIDGEIKNGGIEQLFSNLGEGFDPDCFSEVLKNIKSEKGEEIVQKFIDFIYQSDEHKNSFYGDYTSVSGFNKTLKKLHNELSDEYYRLDPSVEALIVQYAEENWDNVAFQEAIKEVVFENEEKDEAALIGDLNDAIKSGNVATIKKILKVLKTVNQACEYGFVPIIELTELSSNAKKIEICKLLIDHGADLNFRDKYQNSVLHKAAESDNSIEFIEFLLDQGMDIETKDDYDNTPLFNTNYNPENANLLISRGANVHAKNRNSYSPLTKMLDRYEGWYGNQYAKNYHPKIKKVIDLLLAAGAGFNKEILIHETTELAKFAEDPKMLKHLLKQKSVKDAPEFNPDYQKWSAVFQASLKGNIESLKLLTDKGAFLNQTLDVPHYETKTFSGGTPMNVAFNDEIREFLVSQNVFLGNRKDYSIFLETRGNDEKVVIELIQQIKNIKKEDSVKYYHTVKKKMDETYEKIDGKYVIYKPLFLKNTESDEEIRMVELQFKKYNCELTLI